MKIDNTMKGNFQINVQGVYDQGWSISLVLSEDEANQLIAAYDPKDDASPTEGTCRDITRLILDAVIEKMN